MSATASGPSTLKGALVSVSDSGDASIIPFQYNPANLRRSLQPQMVGGEENDRSEAVRFTGAPIQTIDVEIELDATDALNAGDETAVENGISPTLSALELLVYPEVSQITNTQSLLESGIMEIAPMTSPRVLFVWGPNRVLPVRIQSYSIQEEQYDSYLNPIQAVVSLSMRVLKYSDLSSDNKEYNQFMAYHQTLVTLAGKALTSTSDSLGVDTGQF